jgi:hypothetical protein
MAEITPYELNIERPLGLSPTRTRDEMLGLKEGELEAAIAAGVRKEVADALVETVVRNESALSELAK